MLESNTIDFIGDVHGHAYKLIVLLNKLGYTYNGESYFHPDNRKVLFVGDYIDRGPNIKETLDIVKKMVASGNAIALMGNHEYNALCFHFQEREGGHLRKHEIKNIIQHYETLRQFQNKQKEYEEYIDWIKTLPLFYETEDFRAVHACWDKNDIDFLKKKLSNGKLTNELIYESAKKGSRLNTAIDVTLKGKETSLPDGLNFKDKDGTVRTEIRVKWWEDPLKSSYKKLSVVSIDKLPNLLIPKSKLSSSYYYNETDKPIFFGHYWLNGKPLLYRNNICCLDYSVAKQGHLVAYRFNGEKKLNNKNLIYV